MANGKIARELWRLFSEQKWEESKKLFHPQFEVFWPQSQERFVGADNFVGMNQAYPGNHKAEILHLVEAGDRVACTVFISADTGQTAYATTYFEFKDSQIFRMTEYWGEKYDAPNSRAKWRSS